MGILSTIRVLAGLLALMFILIVTGLPEWIRKEMTTLTVEVKGAVELQKREGVVLKRVRISGEKESVLDSLYEHYYYADKRLALTEKLTGKVSFRNLPRPSTWQVLFVRNRKEKPIATVTIPERCVHFEAAVNEEAGLLFAECKNSLIP